MTDFRKIIRENQVAPPVDLAVIGRALGVDIFRHNGLPDSISGLIRKNPDDPSGNYQCFVNAKQSLGRQRFTVAHELAHYCLHKDEIGDGISDDYLYRSGLTGLQEREANQLAAEILMPRHLMEQVDYKNRSISELARIFDVSEAAMEIRVRPRNG